MLCGFSAVFKWFLLLSFPLLASVCFRDSFTSCAADFRPSFTLADSAIKASRAGRESNIKMSKKGQYHESTSSPLLIFWDPAICDSTDWPGPGFCFIHARGNFVLDVVAMGYTDGKTAELLHGAVDIKVKPPPRCRRLEVIRHTSYDFVKRGAEALYIINLPGANSSGNLDWRVEKIPVDAHSGEKTLVL